MLTPLRSILLTFALSTAAPVGVQAQILPAPSCPHCQLSASHCTCTTLRPVVETRYRQEQIVTYQDVSQVAYRPEAVCETVPVTTYETVTSDEGGYQLVWIPKPVTRQVARTSLTTRLSYRNVPYLTTQRIPQVTTQLVPETSLRCVPQTTRVLLHQTHGTRPVSSEATVPDAQYLETPAAADYEELMTVPQRKAETVSHEDSGTAKRFIAAPPAATVWQSRRGMQRN